MKVSFNFTTLALTTAALLIATRALAFERDPHESDFFNEMPVVLNATRLQQSILETPASITIIDQALIRASTATTVPDLLRYVAGFQIARPSGSETTQTYHGISDQHARRMQVLLDGRSVYNQIVGGVFWDLLPLTIEDIDRIEVIRGPNAAAYGTNSFFAVVNIITKDPAKYYGTSTRFDVGSHGMGRAYVRHASSAGGVRYALTGAYDQHDGLFDARADDYRAAHATLRGDYQINTTDALEWGLSYRDAVADSGRKALPLEIRERDGESNHQSLLWRRSNAVDDAFEISLTHSYLQSREAFFRLLASEELSQLTGRPILPEMVPLFTGRPDGRFGFLFDYDERRYEADVQRTQRWIPSLRVVYGAGYRSDRARAPAILDGGSAARSHWRGYMHGEWEPGTDKPGPWVINLGTMYEDHDDLSGRWSPRLGINYRLDPTSSIRLVGSRAYRMPTFLDYSARLIPVWPDRQPFEIIGQPNLTVLYSSNQPHPEKITAYELGYFTHLLDHRLSVDAKIFRNEIEGLIRSQRDDPVNFPITRSYDNNNDATHTGFESQVRYQDRSNFVSFAYSYVNAHRSGRRSVDPDRWTPLHTANVLYSRQLDRYWVASVSVFFEHDMRWLGEGSALPAREWVDVKLERSWRRAATETVAGVYIQNIFDEKNPDFRLDNIDERRFLLSLRHQF